MKFVTIGVYGWNETAFFNALRGAGVDTFCDIRWRRGVRGPEYAFVNSEYLQKRLRELGIRYLHFRELAPKPKLRQRQFIADRKNKTTQRKRTNLGPAFIAGYCAENLSAFDGHNFVQKLGPGARIAALFCFEREPAACHRSVLAERLQRELGLKVVHLLPDKIISPQT